MRNFVLLPFFRVEAGRLLSLTFLLVLLFSVPAFAQVERRLDKKISLKINNVSLADALRKVRELSDVRFSFQQADVNKQPNVTVDLSNTTVRKVLEKLLAESNLQFVEASNGTDVLIVEKQKKKDATRGAKYIDAIGIVSDNKGAALPNVSVMLLPENRGYVTDKNGYFSVYGAAEGSTLRFSFLGMKTTDYVVKAGKGDNFIRIAMDTAPMVMAEYVITGYQNVDKRMLTGAAVTLTPDKFLTAGVASVDQMLQGKVPGMMTVFNSGSPSSSPKIRIRGTSTILGNAAPLWVVDGIIREDPVNLSPLQINAALQAAQDANFAIVGNAISGINPYDIESITFLKDASATAIYGVRAANGVIVVKTKRGKAGPLSITYNVDMGFTAKPSYSKLNLMNSKERIDLSREIYANGIYFGAQPIPVSYEGLVDQLNRRVITQEEFNTKVGALETMNTDWFDELARNAFNHTHSLSFSGGAGKTTYYASLSYSDNNGTFKGDNLKRYTGRINLETVVNSKLSLNFFIDGGYRKSEGFYQVNPMDYALMTSRTINKDEFYSAIVTTAFRSGNVTIGSEPISYNIFNELANTGNSTTSQNLTVTAGLNYKILPGLTFSGSYSGSTSSNSSFSYGAERSFYISRMRGYDYGKYAFGSTEQKRSLLPYGGLAYPSNGKGIDYTLRNQLNYNLNLFDGRDQFSAMVTQEVRSAKFDQLSSQEVGYYPERGNTYFSDYYGPGSGAGANTHKHYVDSRNTIENTMSWLGNISYRLNKKYTLSANIRSDGSNRFGQFSNQRFLPNWSLGGRWDLSEESWMLDLPWVNMIAFRGSYGSQGNVVKEVGPELIASYPSTPADVLSGEYMLKLKSLPYPDLRWEKSKSYNVGVDVNLLNSRLMFSFDAYYRRTTDLLLNRDIPLEFGVEKMLQNYGKMENKGFDGSLTVVPVKTKVFEWNQGFNYSMNLNNVSRSEIINTLGDYLNGRAVIPGRAYGSFYSYAFAGLNPANGIPNFDFNKGPVLNPDDPSTWLAYSGRIDPIVEFSTSTGLRYKSFSLNAFFVVKLGNKRRLNALYPSGTTSAAPPPELNLTREFVKRWRQPGDEQFTNIPAFANWYQLQGYVKQPNNVSATPYSLYDLSDARLVNGSFLRCTNIAGSYMVPAAVAKKIGLKGMTVNASVNNPFVIADKALHGQDPEAANTGQSSMPITASFFLSLGVNF